MTPVCEFRNQLQSVEVMNLCIFLSTADTNRLCGVQLALNVDRSSVGILFAALVSHGYITIIWKDCLLFSFTGSVGSVIWLLSGSIRLHEHLESLYK